jgi:leucine dehydrogenase
MTTNQDRARTLHDALTVLGWTTLEINAPQQVVLSREWDASCEFSVDRWRDACAAATAAAKIEGAAAQRQLKDAGAKIALDEIQQLLAAGGHERFVLRVHAGLGMRVATFIHSTVRGAAAGGTRWLRADVDELDALTQGANLSRAMTHKNAWAELPWGGCKVVMQSAPFPIHDSERMGFFAFCLERDPVNTGPDLGITGQFIDELRARYTNRILCGDRGELGPTGEPTARGVYVAMRTAAEKSRLNLRGARVVIQGLGAVGWPLAKQLHADGADLIVADIDGKRCENAAEVFGAQVLADPNEAPFVDSDVFCPCATGHVFEETNIPSVRTRLIYGAANNQIHATCLDQEVELSRLMQSQGALLQPDWTYTLGGITQGFEVFSHGGRASHVRVRQHIDDVCTRKTRQLLNQAEATAMTPTECAYEMVAVELASRSRGT